MEMETRNYYVDFYYNMSKACYVINENSLLMEISMAMDKTSMAKSYYLKLKESGVDDIEHLRGCLNTLEKKLGMEVTQ